jgi:hypothetical protein
VLVFPQVLKHDYRLNDIKEGGAKMPFGPLSQVIHTAADHPVNPHLGSDEHRNDNVDKDCERMEEPVHVCEDNMQARILNPVMQTPLPTPKMGRLHYNKYCVSCHVSVTCIQGL